LGIEPKSPEVKNFISSESEVLPLHHRTLLIGWPDFLITLSTSSFIVRGGVGEIVVSVGKISLLTNILSEYCRRIYRVSIFIFLSTYFYIDDLVFLEGQGVRSSDGINCKAFSLFSFRLRLLTKKRQLSIGDQVSTVV
jgi:hypothetical protein